MNDNSIQFPPGISITSYSNTVAQSFINTTSIVTSINASTNSSLNAHLYDTGRLLSEMIQIDITDNSYSIGHCNTYMNSDIGHNDFRNNITIYLPRNDGPSALNQPSLKSQVFFMFCRRFQPKIR